MPTVLPRFYAPDLDERLEHVALPRDEGRHLTRVLRLGRGDEVAVFDGRGAEMRARVEVVGRDEVSVRLLDRLPVADAPLVPVTVVQAVLKGTSMDAAVRDATMMGAAAIEPVLTEHTDVKVAVARRPETVDRWRRVALAAVKQCRRATLPRIQPPLTFDEWLGASTRQRTLVFVEPSARHPARPLSALLASPIPASATVLLGPEGGWSEAELDAAIGAGCVPVVLGPLTLRAESMPVAALAALIAIWQK